MLKQMFLKQKIQTQGLGIALGGGSVRGFFHIGVLLALEDFNIKISYITGISVGSLIGGFYASGLKAIEILDILSKHTDFNTLLNSASLTIFNKQGLFSGEEMIKEINTLVNFKTIEQLPIPFACRAVDLQHFKEVIFDSGDLGKAIKNSCSIPGIFIPEENDRFEMLVDGGVLGSVPLALLQSKFNGPTLSSNLISYDNISASQAHQLEISFSQNIIHKLLPFTENIFRSFYLMQSYITTLEYEKYKPDLSVSFQSTYNPSFSNIMQIKDQLVDDGYIQTKKMLKQLGF